MAKSDPKKEPELHPEAWARFERAVDVVAKSPPQHRTKDQSEALLARLARRSERQKPSSA
jgi:hypothetical protein